MKNYHTHNGKTLTIPQWAKSPENIHGVSVGCLRYRVQVHKLTIEESLSYPPTPKRYQYRGKSLTLVEWSEDPANRHKLTVKGLYRRIRDGMTIAQALTTPSRESKIKDHIVVKFVQANGKQYATYWQGGFFSRVGDPLPLTKAQAAIVTRHHGGRVEPLHQAQSA